MPRYSPSDFLSPDEEQRRLAMLELEPRLNFGAAQPREKNAARPGAA
jgi:hypothetical protein